MNNDSVVKTDMQNIRSVFGESLTQRFLTYKLIGLLQDSGILKLLTEEKTFTFESVKSKMELKLGFNVTEPTRARMIRIIIDLLFECQLLQQKGDLFIMRDFEPAAFRLSCDDTNKVNTLFSGLVSFFEKCIDYAEDFLRGGSPLFRFDEDSMHVWGSFLGNVEYETARILLMKLLSSRAADRCSLLNLCSGMGFDIVTVQKVMPDTKITAIDFTDVFYESTLQKIKGRDNIQWVDSSLWKGFGHPLPFNDHSFDLLYFACADPYIASDLREFVYSDIYRVLKSGGSAGILTNSYPDPDGSIVNDTWIRRGILCHDFAESVCEGWHGFSLPDDSMQLFEKIGFDISSVIMNASLWRLDKP